MIAVRKSATVPQAPHDAFGLFVDHMARWWPLATHSVGRTAAASVTFGHGVGGRIVETIAGGSSCVGGRSPPLTAVAGGTEVELIHTGWDSRPDAPEARASDEGGWEYVLGLYAAGVG